METVNGMLQSVKEEAEKLCSQLKGVEEEKEKVEKIKQEKRNEISEESLLVQIISSLDILIERFERQTKDIHKELQQQTEEEKKLLEEKNELTQQLKEYQKRVEVLEKLNQELQQQQNEMNKNVDKAALTIDPVEVERMREFFSAANNSAGSSDNHRIQRIIDSLKCDNTKLRSDITSLKSDISRLQNDKTRLESDNATLQSDFQQIVASMMESNDMHIRFEKILEEKVTNLTKRKFILFTVFIVLVPK